MRQPVDVTRCGMIARRALSAPSIARRATRAGDFNGVGDQSGNGLRGALASHWSGIRWMRRSCLFGHSGPSPGHGLGSVF